MTVSSRALIMLADVLRRNRVECGLGGAGWIPGRQALLVVSYLRKGAAYAELGQGFGIDTTTVYRYLREALELEAAMAPTLAEAIQIARGRAYVILDGTMLRIDRVAMTGGQDRAAPMSWREPGSGDPRPLSTNQKAVNTAHAPATRTRRTRQRHPEELEDPPQDPLQPQPGHHPRQHRPDPDPRQLIKLERLCSAAVQR